MLLVITLLQKIIIIISANVYETGTSIFCCKCGYRDELAQLHITYIVTQQWHVMVCGDGEWKIFGSSRVSRWIRGFEMITKRLSTLQERILISVFW